MTNREWHAILGVHGIAPKTGRLTIKQDGAFVGYVEPETDFGAALKMLNSETASLVLKFVKMGDDLEKKGVYELG